jgi:hypothetical protein
MSRSTAFDSYSEARVVATIWPRFPQNGALGVEGGNTATLKPGPFGGYMKHTTLKNLVLSCLLVILAFASVSAQSNNHIRVNIPFDFIAGKAQLKAGAYIVRSSSESILVLRRIQDKTDTFVFAPNKLQRPETNLSAKLVFHRHRNEYFLAEAWTNRNTIGRIVNQTTAEHRVARQLARAKMKSEVVEVTAALK